MTKRKKPRGPRKKMLSEDNPQVEKYLKELTVKEVLERYELDHKDIKIMELQKKYPNITDKEIGVIVDLSRAMVCIRRNTEKFKAAYEQCNMNAPEIIHSTLTHAARVYVDLLEDPDPSIRERVARVLLKSSGIIKDEPSVQITNITPRIIEFSDGGRLEIDVTPSNDPNNPTPASGIVGES